MNLLNTIMLILPTGADEFIMLLILAFAALVLPIIVFIDILKSKFENNNKLIWLLVVLFLNIIGALLYFFIGRKQKTK